MPRPPCDALQAVIHLREHREQAGQMLGRNADAVVPHRHRAPRPSTSADSSMRPPGSVYLALLFSRFQNTWASRVRSASR